MAKKERKPYLKPEIKQVKLVSKQAVLANCKSGAAGIVACQGEGEECGDSTAWS